MRGYLSRGMVAAILFSAVCFSPFETVQGALSTNLDNVIVYPNPFQAQLSHTVITFDNLTESSRIRIYKLTGEKVSDITVATVTGRATWDLTNSDGGRVAPGVYLYLVTNPSGQKTTGKMAIVR